MNYQLQGKSIPLKTESLIFTVVMITLLPSIVEGNDVVIGETKYLDFLWFDYPTLVMIRRLELLIQTRAVIFSHAILLMRMTNQAHFDEQQFY